MQQLSPHLYHFRDTCHVYAVCAAERTVLVDFGSGKILEALASRGLPAVSDVLLTHHHRDQAQGLARAVAAGIRIWVPHTEQDLFQEVDVHWQAREIFNNYNMRQDRFSLLEPVPIAGTLRDYETMALGDLTFTVLPTPGHTTGSVTLLAQIDGRRVAFSGDLIAGPGQVWSLAATQWSYNGAEGVALTIFSLEALKQRQPDLLLPSHGILMPDPQEAIDLLVARLGRLLSERQENPRLFLFLEEPYEELSPHLLFNRTSMANSYVLLSESGKALLVDYGYDCIGGLAPGSDRASRRPWLYTLPRLKEQYGVGQIEVAIPTHFHDDHVAGFNLLRDVEGTAVWAAESIAPILETPAAWNLPCLWYDPIPVDRTLPLGETFRWQEYELTLYALPGHTRYAVAILFEVDGRCVLASGDQYQGADGLSWNYVYQNGFQIEDYQASARLYRRLAPDLILSGHWAPLWTTPDYFEALAERGQTLARLHRELLPPERLTLGAEGIAASIDPYQALVAAGETVTLAVTARNPLAEPAEGVVRLVVPEGWQALPARQTVSLPPAGTAVVEFALTPPAEVKVRRARVAADLTVGDRRLGEQAEALVTVR